MNSKSESSAVNPSSDVVGTPKMNNDVVGTPKLNYDISPMIQRSMEAFRRDLPGLLQIKKRLGQWVAYHGDRQLGFAKTKTQLYQECLRQGLKIDEFIVMRVAPDLPDEIDPEELIDL
jgi:hypothetical protein